MQTDIDILIVEDSPTQAEKLRHVLDTNGHRATVARNGREALDAIRQRPPAMVITDIVMPEMDGYELCRQIKADLVMRHVPVMLLTSLSEPVDVIRGLESGADSFHVKPWEERQILSRIGYLLANRQMREVDTAQPGIEISISFAAKTFLINSDRLQILNFLLASYETAIDKAAALNRAQDELRTLNEHLEEKVHERTLALEAEIAERERVAMALQASERDLKLINGIANVFLTVSDEEMYGEVLNVVLEAMESQYGVFGYIDEDGALVVPSMTRHIWDACQIADKRFVFPRESWGDSSWPRCIREKRAIYSNEHSALTPQGHLPVIRHISMPILFRDEPIGLFQVANKRDDYDEKDVQLLQAVAENVAPILHARLQSDRQEARRREAEQALRHSKAELTKRAEQLARSNSELEQFAYVASHDLKEPLRMVASYTSLLAEAYRGKIDAEADKYIHYATDGAKRMQELIEDLLEYSRVGRTNEGVQPVEVQTAIDWALMNLEHRIKDLDARIDIGPMPVVVGRESELARLFQNVIGNALKFHSDQKPVVGISSARDNGNWRITIADNGIGIESDYRERIFGVFQRLHTREEYAGNGIGLAVCKKIVERHGGRIWVESEAGNGTKVHFTLPACGEGTGAEKCSEFGVQCSACAGHPSNPIIVGGQETTGPTPVVQE